MGELVLKSFLTGNQNINGTTVCPHSTPKIQIWKYLIYQKL